MDTTFEQTERAHSVLRNQIKKNIISQTNRQPDRLSRRQPDKQSHKFIYMQRNRRIERSKYQVKIPQLL